MKKPENPSKVIIVPRPPATGGTKESTKEEAAPLEQPIEETPAEETPLTEEAGQEAEAVPEKEA